MHDECSTFQCMQSHPGHNALPGQCSLRGHSVHVQNSSNRNNYNVYWVFQEKWNGGFSELCNPKVSHVLASPDKASSFEKNDTEIIELGWVIFIQWVQISWNTVRIGHKIKTTQCKFNDHGINHYRRQCFIQWNQRMQHFYEQSTANLAVPFFLGGHLVLFHPNTIIFSILLIVILTFSLDWCGRSLIWFGVLFTLHY